MKQVKILLIELNPASGLGDTLRGILESSLNVDIQLRYESIGIYEPAPADLKIPAIISDFKPTVIFLVLAPVLLKQTSGIFHFLGMGESHVPIIVVIEGCNPDEMFSLLTMGAADFITPPLTAIDILPRIWRLLEQTRQSKTLTFALKEKLGLGHLVGECPVFLAAINKIPIVARCDASVLISGETGTGKELCARAIHYLSPRTGKPFVPVTCGAIPTELIENELFGHVQGAFTGAASSQPGLIREADGGTLLLDDIDCLPPAAQAKLLRFLQEKEYRELGSTKTRHADVRIIAATNISLEQAVREGTFRRDLYYRLNIIPLTLPPLRERREDIPFLAHHFLKKYAAELERPAKDLASDAIEKLLFYEWPGNVRELEYIIERAVVFSAKTVLDGVDIDLPKHDTTVSQESFKAAKTRIIDQFERDYIRGLLLAYQGNISQAARAAQKNRRAFWQLIRKHQIDTQGFRLG